jgi:Fungal specific transcription factor domain
MWQFLADNDSLAWRLTGIAARWCLEIGLNQSLLIRQVPGSDHDRKMAVRLFWCIHALDRRWGFGNGLPFVIQDSDIDQAYPEPVSCKPLRVASADGKHFKGR